MSIVGLVFGGRSVEHKVSIASARTVARALAEAGHRVVPLGIAQDGCWLDAPASRRALDGELDAFPPAGLPVAPTLEHLLRSGSEVLFPIVHGTWGEDGTLQGLAEMLDLPYAGTGVTSSALAMDKLFAKRQLEAAGVPVVDYEAVDRRDLETDPAAVLARLDRFEPPVFVKPSIGGSSVGITKVKHRDDLHAALVEALRFDDRLVVERGVVGRELECAVLGNRQIEASVVGEIVPGKEFYDYADKYLDDGARLIAPAELPAEVAERLRARAAAAFTALGGWGMARVDFFLETTTGELFVNEINTLPGFTAISMYPRLWGLSGIPLPQLVDRLVNIARERHAERRRLDDGIKEWIATLERS